MQNARRYYHYRNAWQRSEGYMAKSCAKWLKKNGVNVLTMSPAKKNFSHHNYPLERIEKAIEWLKNNGNKKIGIVGGSTTGTLALTAASYFPDITLTIAMTASDFIWQGFEQGKKDGCRECLSRGNRSFHIVESRCRICRFVISTPSIGR